MKVGRGESIAQTQISLLFSFVFLGALLHLNTLSMLRGMMGY